MTYTKDRISELRKSWQSHKGYPVRGETLISMLDEIERITASRDAWKADAERLAEKFAFWDDAGIVTCVHCGATSLLDSNPKYLDHAPDCPIELHEKLESEEKWPSMTSSD